MYCVHSINIIKREAYKEFRSPEDAGVNRVFVCRTSQATSQGNGVRDHHHHHIQPYMMTVLLCTGCTKHRFNLMSQVKNWPTRTINLHVDHAMVDWHPQTSVERHPKYRSEVRESEHPLCGTRLFPCWARCQEMRSKKLSKGSNGERLERRHSQRTLGQEATSGTNQRPQSQGKGKQRKGKGKTSSLWSLELTTAIHARALS